jgi:hypothetical protein
MEGNRKTYLELNRSLMNLEDKENEEGRKEEKKTIWGGSA